MPTRVGDTWTFQVTQHALPREQYVIADLGAVPADEDYLAILTARATWVDAIGTPYMRTFGLTLELVAYEGTNALGDWDNDLHVVQDRTYLTTGTAERHDQPVIAQAVVHPPTNCDNLKLQMVVASADDGASSIVIEEATVILTIVTPRV
jgi:hypothetical protein